jgi:hypothetical protein
LVETVMKSTPLMMRVMGGSLGGSLNLGHPGQELTERFGQGARVVALHGVARLAKLPLRPPAPEATPASDEASSDDDTGRANLALGVGIAGFLAASGR